MRRKTLIAILAALLVVLAVLIVLFTKKLGGTEEALIEEDPGTLYGIRLGDHYIEEGEILPGEHLSGLLGRYGIGARGVDSLVRISEGIFDIRTIQAGRRYFAFLTPDSTRRLDHFVYARNTIDYVVFNFGDSLSIRVDSLPVLTERRMAEATIESSLWNAMVGQGHSPGLAMELSDIYAWTIDFFGVQQGDSFKVIYDERFVDSLSIGHGRIWGAWFEHGGKRYNAIPFEQDGKISYWDEAGNSLRKSMLKAPLSYSRISSRFSNARLHPILRIRRPHHGVDYAAPSGTPVYAVADGTITRASYDRSGGNTIRIKHSRGLETAYLHLSKYGAGIRAGRRVSQGDLIGYVGSTGLSTGPHLDYRVYQNGTAIDPLKIPTEPAEPISNANRAAFERMRDVVLGALDDTVPIGDISLNPTPTVDKTIIPLPYE